MDLFQHSMQSARLAAEDDQIPDMVVGALIHDIGDKQGGLGHGKMAASILRPFAEPAVTWVIEHHDIVQGYYYFSHAKMNSTPGILFRRVGHEYVADTAVQSMVTDHTWQQLLHDFCEKYDRPAFATDTDRPPFTKDDVEQFRPHLDSVFSREPFWHITHSPLKVDGA
jgi:predicted HD phosphohydrolase